MCVIQYPSFINMSISNQVDRVEYRMKNYFIYRLLFFLIPIEIIQLVTATVNNVIIIYPNSVL